MMPMNGLLARLLILALAVFLIWLAVSATRRFIDAERQRAMRASDMEKNACPAVGGAAPGAPVHILAFSSQTCRPCYTLQRPALEAISAQKGSLVDVTWIDAPSSPELTERYHVLTVPTTVVLDSKYIVEAINYGFAPTTRLLEQINDILHR